LRVSLKDAPITQALGRQDNHNNIMSLFFYPCTECHYPVAKQTLVTITLSLVPEVVVGIKPLILGNCGRYSTNVLLALASKRLVDFFTIYSLLDASGGRWKQTLNFWK